MTLYPNLIKEALKSVRYPGDGKNIIENGMLEDDIHINGMNVEFSLIFKKQKDPFMNSLLKATEVAIHTFIDKNVQVKINTKILTEQTPEPEKMLPQVKNIIAVSSGKGGVGKSTVAVNLALGLSKMGYRVGILDADIFGPSVPKMFQLEDARPFAENIEGKDYIVPVERHGLKILSIGFFVDPDTPTLWRGGMASNALKQLLADALWGELDYLVIDTPPGTSDIHLTLIQNIDITGAVIVSTPQEVALADARKGLNMYKNDKVNIPIIGLVENMAWFTPLQHPDEKYFIFGKDGCARLAEKLHVPLLAQIPLIKDVCESGDNGEPALLNPASNEGMAFMQMTAKIVTQVDKLHENQLIEQ